MSLPLFSTPLVSNKMVPRSRSFISTVLSLILSCHIIDTQTFQPAIVMSPSSAFIKDKVLYVTGGSNYQTTASQTFPSICYPHGIPVHQNLICSALSTVRPTTRCPVPSSANMPDGSSSTFSLMSGAHSTSLPTSCQPRQWLLMVLRMEKQCLFPIDT